MVTVTGHVTDTAGNGLQGAAVSFQLVDSSKLQAFGCDQPRVSSTEVLFPPYQDSAIAGAGGAFSINIAGNDAITPTGTLYAVSYSYDGKSFGPIYYSITGSAVDLDSALPVVTPPPAPPYTPALIVNVISAVVGDFTVAHTLGRVPNGAIFTPTSSAGVWFQANANGSPKMDSTTLYLVASDVGESAQFYLF